MTWDRTYPYLRPFLSPEGGLRQTQILPLSSSDQAHPGVRPGQSLGWMGHSRTWDEQVEEEPQGEVGSPGTTPPPLGPWGLSPCLRAQSSSGSPPGLWLICMPSSSPCSQGIRQAWEEPCPAWASGSRIGAPPPWPGSLSCSASWLTAQVPPRGHSHPCPGPADHQPGPDSELSRHCLWGQEAQGPAAGGGAGGAEPCAHCCVSPEGCSCQRRGGPMSSETPSCSLTPGLMGRAALGAQIILEFSSG